MPPGRAPLMHLAIVDDADVMRALVRRMAVARGHRVSEAADLETGVRLVAQDEPDAIVVDGRLPGGGLVAVAQLRSAAPRAAICAIAALDEVALVRDARAAGAAHVLLRPLLPSHVAAFLTSIAP